MQTNHYFFHFNTPSSPQESEVFVHPQGNSIKIGRVLEILKQLQPLTLPNKDQEGNNIQLWIKYDPRRGAGSLAS